MDVLGQYGRIWQLLHPRYQRVTTRTFWEACKRKNAMATVQMKSIKAIDSYPDTITLPLLGKIRVRAVTLQMHYSIVGVSGTQTVSDTTYWNRYRGQWIGLWELADYQAYSRHKCPAK